MEVNFNPFPYPTIKDLESGEVFASLDSEHTCGIPTPYMKISSDKGYLVDNSDAILPEFDECYAVNLFTGQVAVFRDSEAVLRLDAKTDIKWNY